MAAEDITTWRKELEFARIGAKDDSPVVYICPTNLDLDREFDRGFGGTNGEAFTIWTEEMVYFPAMYNGLEWVESVPRNPRKHKTPHVGGS